MYFITDQLNQKLALIHRNIILDNAGSTVLGITIGDCLFNNHSKVFGKIINSTAYLLNGEIIGKVSPANPMVQLELNDEQINASWDILTKINEHACPWIDTKNEWSLLPFSEHLS
jgi:hypothetical protein